MITCEICKKSMKMMTNSHLKSHHINMTEYRLQYPNAVTISTELSKQFTQRSIKSNESRKGVARTPTEMANILNGIKAAGPRIAANKGVVMSEAQKILLRNAANIRNTNWRDNNNHPLLGNIQSSETKDKIRTGVVEYAIANRNKLKERAAKSITTKTNNGYYSRKRLATLAAKTNVLASYGFHIIDDMLETCYWSIKCQNCDTIFKRHKDSIVHEHICRTCYPVCLSNAEDEIYDFMKQYSSNIHRQNRDLIEGLEIDIYLPDFKLAIEYNGLYWHSEKQGKKQWYHITKTNLLAGKGIRLIHIFEDEWLHKQTIVKARLAAILDQVPKLGARKCQIVELTSPIANTFYSEHHIQGMTNSKFNYGLEYNNKLVAAMSFNPPNRAKGSKSGNFDYELTRYCSIGKIIGGASKLFKHFLKCHPSTKIVSYSDRRWNLGDMYQNLGFTKVGDTTPNYWYIDCDKRIYRYKLRLNEHDDPTLTEWENRQKQGWNRIWDCGSTKWLFVR